MSLAQMKAGFLRVLYGAGHVPPPSSGARDIAYGDPPVQATDSYEWIQPAFFTDAAPGSPVRIGEVPPAYQDWNEYPVTVGDQASTFGGGEADPSVIGTAGVPLSMAPQDNLYYNTNNNLFYNVPDWFVQVPDNGEPPPL